MDITHVVAVKMSLWTIQVALDNMKIMIPARPCSTRQQLNAVS